MSRERILIGIGILVLISPWSGLPMTWLMRILPILGLAVIGIGSTLLMRTKETHSVHQENTLPAEAESSSAGSPIAFS